MVFTTACANESILKEFYEQDYRRTNYLSPITVQRYEALLDEFEPLRKTNKLLDVGAGSGFFMEVARSKGWEVYGTEFVDNIVEQLRSKDFNVSKGSLEEIGFDSDSFDIIVSIEVIEHLIDPKSTVREMQRLVRPGGLVYITTPNFNSLLRYRLKDRYDIISFPLHLSYFTVKTLRKMFENEGFERQIITTTGFSRTRLRTSKGQSNQDYVSETSDDEMIRYRIEHNGFLRAMKSFTNTILNTFKVGDSIKARFIKK